MYGLNVSAISLDSTWKFQCPKQCQDLLQALWKVSHHVTFTPAGLGELVLLRSLWIRGWKTINSKAGPISCWGSARCRQQEQWVAQLRLNPSRCGLLRSKDRTLTCPVIAHLQSVHGVPFQMHRWHTLAPSMFGVLVSIIIWQGQHLKN